ncbi:MAG: hypothetical protein B7Z72_00250 [Gemmatimonadetes bacterium 21-71-4]|nr:MAG: hypothetical protein B7Z72_00250 [Gemmatimonadetes bacterium 21-71-4]
MDARALRAALDFGLIETLAAAPAQAAGLDSLGIGPGDVNLCYAWAQNAEISNGQFLPLYFDSWDQVVQATTAFLDANGDPRSAEPSLRGQVALLASMFPTVQDRNWLRLFVQALGDESEHFYHQYWIAQQRARRPVAEAVDSLWQSLRPRFQRFLTNTHQLDGQIVLSLVLGGEGRTLNAAPDHNVMVVTLPASTAAVAEPIYVVAHELVQTIAATAINDNASPAEQRDGVAAGYAPTAAVRGGEMLIQRVAPELGDGFMRFYLSQAGVTPPASGVQAVFTSTFQLPTAIVADLARQINQALGGS